LNWNRQEQALTQGQAQGKRVVARAVQIEEVETQSNEPAAAGQTSPMGQAEPASAVVDAGLIAQRVYELLRQELRVERARRNNRR
jgi:hypothetical protein